MRTHKVETMCRAILFVDVSSGSRNGAAGMRDEFLPRFYRRVQPGVLSCMTDIDMCTRVSESKPSRDGGEAGPFLPSRERMYLFPLPSSPRIRFQSGSSCTRNPENWTKRSHLLLPTSVLQMNDQLESHKSTGSIVGAI